MKIIHNTNIWLPLTQTWVYTQIKCLPEDFDVEVACQKTENLDQFSDVKTIHCLQQRCSRFEYTVRRTLIKAHVRRSLGWLKKPLYEFKPNLIHSHFGDIGWAALPEIKNSVPHIVSFYGYDLSMLPRTNPKWKKRYKELFNKVAAVLCEGEHMASCIEALGCSPKKIHIQRIGVLLDRIPYKPRIWNKNETLHILLAGRFTEKKGFPYALSALAKLSKDLPLAITIIGDAGATEADQNEKNIIIKAIEDGNITGKVKFLGYQSYKVLFEEAYKHHIFLSPSVTAANGDTEGGAPVSIIEMASTGMPVVSTKHCDIPRVILDGQTGLLADERDVNGLYERLIWLLSNTEKWRVMLDRCRAHMEEDFDAYKQGKKLADIYKKFA